MGLIDSPLLKKIRRNHSLEHATVHVLQQRLGRVALVGHSDWHGFTLYGSVDTAEVKLAAHEALRRLRQGQADLAVHPRCGTVIATTGIMTALAALLAVSIDRNSRRRFHWGNLPTVMLATTAAAILAQPIGMAIQERYTTDPDPGNLEIKNVILKPAANLIVHRVETVQ
jgi:hypothetical protein